MLQSGNVEIEKELDIDKEKELKKEKELDTDIDIRERFLCGVIPMVKRHLITASKRIRRKEMEMPYHCLSMYTTFPIWEYA